MFDLFDESGSDLKALGYKTVSKGKYGISHSFLSIKSDGKSKKCGLDKGEYHILTLSSENDDLEKSLYLSSLITKILTKLFTDEKISNADSIMIVGVGNPDVDADKLGKAVFDQIEISNCKRKNVYKFCPNIYFSTGIETVDMVKMFVKELKIDLVVLIDSLSTRFPSRLGKSYQITTSGMTPGSGVNRFGKRINKQSVGAKCIAIGVPFMLKADEINGEENNTILVSKDVKEEIANAGFIIAKAISEVL